MLIYNEPEHVYHARDELSSSQVAAFFDDPVKWYYVKEGVWEADEPTAAMEQGTEVHRLIEMNRPPKSVVIPPEVLNKEGHRKGKQYDDWAAKQDRQTKILKQGEVYPLLEIWRQLRLNNVTRSVMCLPKEYREVTATWTHKETGLRCRARYDILWPEQQIWIDWKNTHDVSWRGFGRHCLRHRYHIRWAMYQDCLQSHGIDCQLTVVAIKNKRSWQIAPYKITEDWFELGRRDYEGAMKDIAAYDVVDDLDRPVRRLPMPKWRESEYEQVEE